jgi:outer membrane biosynthesis protein TonB
VSALAASPILRPEREPRSARFWLAVAGSVALHALVIGAWVLFGSGGATKVPPPPTMDVTIADDVGLTASAPQSETPPAESQAPALGAPEDSAPAAATPEKADTLPTPPKPQPAAAPPPKPAAVAKPRPKAVAPPSLKPVKQPATRAPSSSLASIVGKGTGNSGNKATPRGSKLGGIVKGLGATPNNSTSNTPQGAVMSAAATMDINRKIAQQIQPCAQRQSLSAPGVGKIRVVVTLSFSRDGNPSAAPRIVRLEGVDDDNQRYADQVRQRALAAFQDARCQPIRGLPPELYDVPKGWRSVTLGFKLPG